MLRLHDRQEILDGIRRKPSVEGWVVERDGVETLSGSENSTGRDLASMGDKAEQERSEVHLIQRVQSLVVRLTEIRNRSIA